MIRSLVLLIYTLHSIMCGEGLWHQITWAGWNYWYCLKATNNKGRWPQQM